MNTELHNFVKSYCGSKLIKLSPFYTDVVRKIPAPNCFLPNMSVKRICISASKVTLQSNINVNSLFFSTVTSIFILI